MPRQTGVCVLSIDLSGGAQVERSRKPVESIVPELCQQFVAAELSATWTLGAGQLADATDALSAELARGEVALFAGRAWAGRDANRGQFAEGLSSSLAEIRRVGRQTTTLVFQESPSRLHDDLLVKHGITAVRIGKQRHAACPSGCLRPLRWGLWELEGAIDVVQTGWRRTLKAIDRAARESGEIAIAIDVGKLTAGLKPLTRFANQICRLRDEQRLCVQTIAELVGSRAARPQISAARSILRSAA